MLAIRIGIQGKTLIVVPRNGWDVEVHEPAVMHLLYFLNQYHYEEEG